ncbi:Clan CA, family C19, ubiquitin hydrolase-like cysteine peptidase [Trichomonas vaginalis G3]|uniref:Clan CA, family C19, ubiquitin hydrolase-like cysteine peptidase n=1 Tax=Trichomonas vaginalis (strain ATCC PRA-98 / G3) TaxID=412133 RepID=A2DUQ7_TRIV3|nr:ubiquitinyl hydrolase protein [Trichomonas vaginalis G3]EAY15792.1 Clan CA, family C19, ubiquitin hydrolase-like cysteine peptidase [Trichomonas vaginalis G3]KAI5525038.1 ubiquitinyl hydrolase protein [Trichomonas vaginalis G3]|eukprot:XP_001328015.1 Clan CA, family C19, ubiquitin hydrolase-like cysteine peptidase [Trichomonas vaginalis G3]
MEEKEIESIESVWSIENFSNRETITEMVSMRSSRFFMFKICPNNQEKFNINVEFVDGQLPVYSEITASILSLGKNDEPLSKKINWEVTLENNKTKIEFDLTQEELVNQVYIYNDEMLISLNVKILQKSIEKSDTQEIKNENSKEVEKGKDEYVGLVNQGSTCYMNALIQSLFHIPLLRKTVFEKSDSENKIYSALQQILAGLQLSKLSQGTYCLTDALEMSFDDLLIQKDIHEFSDVVMTSLGDIAKYFYDGKMVHFINCINVDEKSEKIETFMDLSLMVNGVSNIQESLKKYFETEILKNEYKSEKNGMQDVEMGMKIMQCPKILSIHLQRFEYDQNSQRNHKIYSKFEFQDTLDLSEYCYEKQTAEYVLTQVIVHSGNPDFGHYYDFIRPNIKSDQWIKFNDTEVTKCNSQEAIEDNFGGLPNAQSTIEKIYSAYILVYVRKDLLDQIFIDVPNEVIPPNLQKPQYSSESTFLSLIQNSESFKQRKFIQQNQMPLGSLQIYTEDSLESDARRSRAWFESCKSFIPNFVPEKTTLKSLSETISTNIGESVDFSRLWTVKDGFPQKYLDIETDGNKLMSEFGTFNSIFVDNDFELEEADEAKELDNILAFIYTYDPSMNDPLRLQGSQVISIKKKIGEVIEDFIPSIRKYEIEYVIHNKNFSKASPEEQIGFLAEGKSAFIVANAVKPLSAKLFNDYKRKRPPYKTNPYVICSTRLENSVFPDDVSKYVEEERNIVEIKCKQFDELGNTEYETIAFPSNISNDNFFDFLISTFDIQNYDDDEDVIILFPYSNPSNLIVLDLEKTLNEQLSFDSVNEISFTVCKKSSAENYRHLAQVEYKIAELGKVIENKTIFVKNGIPIYLLINIIALEESKEIIPVIVHKHRISSFVDENTSISDTSQPILFDQIKINRGGFLVKICFSKCDEKLRYYGNPFLIKVEKELVVSDLMAIIETNLGKKYSPYTIKDNKFVAIDTTLQISQAINEKGAIILKDAGI